MVCQKLSLYNDIHKTQDNWCCEDILQCVSIQDSSSWLDIIVDIFPFLRPASYLPCWWLAGRRSQSMYSPRTTISNLKWRRGPAAAASSYPGSHGHLSEIILNTVISRRGSAAVAVMGLNCELRVRRCWYGHSSGGTSALHTPGRTHPHINRYLGIVGNSGILNPAQKIYAAQGVRSLCYPFLLTSKLLRWCHAMLQSLSPTGTCWLIDRADG